jgi:hypothetical protein
MLYAIYDAKGSLIISGDLIDSEENNQIDIRGLANGTYYVHLYMGTNPITFTFVFK